MNIADIDPLSVKCSNENTVLEQSDNVIGQNVIFSCHPYLINQLHKVELVRIKMAFKNFFGQKDCHKYYGMNHM